jgi:SIR2-like domain
VFAKSPQPKRVYLVGAGISIDEPSGVTGVPDLLDLIFAQTEVRGGPSRDRYWQAWRSPPAHNPFGASRFEAVLQALTEIAPSTRDALPLMASHGEPNECHHFLASELSKGAIVLTTNFDRRIELACEAQRIACRPFVLSAKNTTPEEGQQLIKLHGSFGTRVRPRATLLSIGRLGLAFSNFPRFRRWLEERGRDCEFVVMGYSASDHFDVVPLIEQTLRPRRVFWMDYSADATAVARTRCEACEDPAIPCREGLEFPSVLLAALAARNAGIEIWRVRADSTRSFIRTLLPDSKPPPLPLEGERKVYAANYKALKQRLSKLRLRQSERREFASMLLEEDSYGGYLGRDFEKGSADDSAERGAKFFASAERDVRRYGVEGAKERLSKLDTSRMTPGEYGAYVAKRFFFETEGEDDAASLDAAKQLVKSEVARGVYGAFRANEMLLMMLEDVFEGASLRRNIPVMRAIARHVKRMFRNAGQLGAGVQALLMEARICHRAILNGARGKRRARLLEVGLEAARQALYFSIRTARDEVIDQSLWLCSYFYESVGARDKALRLLENYVGWIPPTATETRGVTLTNLSLLTARRGDLAKARAYLKRLDAIPEADWPTRRVFGAVARAQLAMAEGKARSARFWIKTGRELVDALSPDDEWRHREELGFLEAELDRGRSA